jgi:hypothetical protein
MAIAGGHQKNIEFTSGGYRILEICWWALSLLIGDLLVGTVFIKIIILWSGREREAV